MNVELDERMQAEVRQAANNDADTVFRACDRADWFDILSQRWFAVERKVPPKRKRLMKQLYFQTLSDLATDEHKPKIETARQRLP